MKKMRGSVLILAALAILCLVLVAGAEAKAIVIYGNTATYVYDGQMHEVTGFSASSSGGFSYIGNAAARGTEVGTYAMGLKADDFLVDPGETIEVIDGWMMITRRPITVNITGHSAVVDYDGQEHTVSGYDVEIDDELYTENDFSFHGDASVSGTAVNSYSMWLDESDFENENNNFDVTFVVTDGRLTIQENQIEIINEGTCGDNLTWTLDSEGMLTISGTGEMYDYSYPSAGPWGSGIKSIAIDDGVTRIGDYAFYNCSSLTSVTIPDSVTTIGTCAFGSDPGNYGDITSITIGSLESWLTINYSNFSSHPNYHTSVCHLYIGNEEISNITIPDSVTSICDYAFSGCGNLTSITIPDSVTGIGRWAFYNCTGLTSLTIPDNVISIGNSAFQSCSSLTSFTIPNNMISVGDSVFAQCSNLTSITIPDGVTSIGYSAFGYCSSLTSITIPENVTRIGGNAFYNCSSLTSITIPDGVTSIIEYTFDGCSSLTSITIPESVTSIGDSAFHACSSLTSITIPDSVTSIGEGAFSRCNSLNEIDVDGNNEHYASIDGVLFDKELRTVIKCPGGFNGAFAIPNSVTRIDDHSFSDCTGLTDVEIPDSVNEIGIFAFSGCNSLAGITIPVNVTEIQAFSFARCSNLTTVELPNQVTIIGLEAFKECNNLKSIMIPMSTTEIGSDAFYECIGLTDVYYAGTEAQWAEISISSGNEALTGAEIHYNYQPTAIVDSGTCGDRLTWTLDHNGLLTISGTGAITSHPWTEEHQDDITEVIMAEGVTEICDEAFDSSAAMKTVRLPNSLRHIGYKVFPDSCTSLEEIYYNGLRIDWEAGNILEWGYTENDAIYGASVHFAETQDTGDAAAVEVQSIRGRDGTMVPGDDGYYTAGIYDTLYVSFTAPDLAGYTKTFRFLNISWWSDVLTPQADGGGIRDYDFQVTTDGDTAAKVMAVYVPSDSSQPILTSTVSIQFHVYHEASGVTISASEAYLKGGNGYPIILSVPETFDLSKVTRLELMIYDSAWETEIYDFSSEEVALQHGTNVFRVPDGCLNADEIYHVSFYFEGVGYDYVSGEIEFKVLPETVVLHLPAELTTIESEAFANLDSAQIIRIPASVTSIADDAFSGSDIIILTPSGSPAQEWAERNGFPYINE